MTTPNNELLLQVREALQHRRERRQAIIRDALKAPCLMVTYVDFAKLAGCKLQTVYNPPAVRELAKRMKGRPKQFRYLELARATGWDHLPTESDARRRLGR